MRDASTPMQRRTFHDKLGIVECCSWKPVIGSLACGFLLLAAISCSSTQGAPEDPGSGSQINGAGATFPYPIYSKWFDEYNKLHPEVRVNYQSQGSGAGIRQLTNETVFFGASDGPMTDDQLKAAPGKI